MFLKPLPSKMQKDCKVILERRSGTRFQYYYHLRREKHAWKSMLFILCGLVCLALAVFFVIMPGPAIPFWFLGAALISSQLLLIARLLDKIEWIIVKTLKDRNKRQIVLIILLPMIFVGTAVGTYLFLSRFLPKPLTIVCAAVGAGLATIVPYKFLKPKKN